MTAWLDTVKKTFKEGRVKNANYKLKDALRDAKKVYKKGEVAVVKVARKTKKAIKRRLKKYSNKKNQERIVKVVVNIERKVEKVMVMMRRM